MRRTLEQYRAADTLAFIRAVAGTDDHEQSFTVLGPLPEIDDKFRTKLHTLIQKTPIRILQNGLGQMLAFLLADNGGKTGTNRQPAGLLYDYFALWLCGTKEESYPCRVYSRPGKLIEQLSQGSRNDYVRALRETMALINWLKKFADTWLDDGGN